MAIWLTIAVDNNMSRLDTHAVLLVTRDPTFHHLQRSSQVECFDLHSEDIHPILWH